MVTISPIDKETRSDGNWCAITFTSEDLSADDEFHALDLTTGERRQHRWQACQDDLHSQLMHAEGLILWHTM